MLQARAPQGALALALLLIVPLPIPLLAPGEPGAPTAPMPPAEEEAGARVVAGDVFAQLPELPFPLVRQGEGEAQGSFLVLPADAAARVDARVLDVLDLARRGILGADGRVPVVVRTDGVLDDLGALRGLLPGARAYAHFPLVAGKASLADLPALAGAVGTQRVFLDDQYVVHLAESVRLIRADEAHQRHTLGAANITGKGVRIAIIDTGVDYTHPDLGNGCFGAGCKVVGGWDFAHDDADPMDDHGHGTHVAAIAAGLQGVAPGASVLAYKVCDARGLCWVSDILDAIDRAIEEDARIISISLGGPGTADGPLATAVDEAVEQGLVVVSSAGNRGPRDGSVGEPAAARRGIAVGASYKSDHLAWFSSRGPLYNGNLEIIGIKPDVVAPGVDIVAAVPKGSCALCDPSGYRALSGTSMSAPHVSGAAALLLQGRSGWRPDDVKAALMGTARDLHDAAGDRRAQGAGRIDVLDALRAELSVIPGGAFLGIAVTGEQGFNVTLPVEVRNLGRVPMRVNVTAAAPPGTDVAIAAQPPRPVLFLGRPLPPVTLDLPGQPVLRAGETRAFNVTVRVDGVATRDGWHDVALRAEGAPDPALAPPPLPALPAEAPAAPLRLVEAELLTLPALAKAGATFVKSGILHFRPATWFPMYDVIPPSGKRFFVGAPSWGFYLLADPGRYDVLGFTTDLGRFGVVLREGIDHRGNTTIRMAAAEAGLLANMSLLLEDGSPFPPSPRCRRAAQPEPCYLIGEATLRNLARKYAVHMPGPNVAVSPASAEWSLGLFVEYRVGWTTYRMRNFVDLADLPADLTVPPARFQEHRLRYLLPEGDLRGRRVDFCDGWGYVRDIAQGQEERFLIGRDDLPEDSLPGGYMFPTTACDRMSASVERDLPWPPGDIVFCSLGDEECPIYSGHHFRRAVPGGLAWEDYRVTHGFVPLDPRFATRDGAYPVVDGAASFGGEILGEDGIVTISPSTGGAYFTQGFGMLDWWQWAGDKVRFEVRRDGDLLHEGPLTGVQYQRHVQWWDPGGAIEVRMVFDEALPHTAAGARSTYVLRYDAGATEGLHPQVLWTRVNDARGLGTRFAAGDPLRLAMQVPDHGGAAVVDVDVTVRAPGGTAELADLQPWEGDVYLIDLPDLGTGAYDLEVRVRSADGDEVELLQEPAYVVA